MNEWINERKDEWMNEWMIEWMNKLMKGWMYGWMNSPLYECMDEWIDWKEQENYSLTRKHFPPVTLPQGLKVPHQEFQNTESFIY